MLNKKDNINLDYEGYGLTSPAQKAFLTSYILEHSNAVYLNKKRPAIIICPGGGYETISQNEGEPVAIKFNSVGFHAFVLNYSVTPVHFPGALLELSKAVAFVRENAEKYGIDGEKIIVCGFSSGGHLAGSLGVYWREGYIQRYLGFDSNENEPNGLILCYPVITNKPEGLHLASIHNLLGKYADEKELALFALENNVNELVPPTFLWHTSNDNIVSANNSMLFASALSEKDIPYELHIYKSGEHGQSLANEVTAGYLGQINPSCQNWFDMAVKFINSL